MTVPEHLLWATAVILAVLLLRQTLGRRIPALGRYALWLLVVLRLLVPGRLAVWPAPAAEEAVPTPVTQAVQTLPAEGSEGERAPAQTTAPPETGETAPALTAGQVCLALWLTGAAAVGGWFLAGNVRLYRRLRRDRVPCAKADCPVPVYVVADLPGPCLAGLFRPAIYLPPAVADDPAACRHALTHELCHRAHGDHFWALLRGICLTLWWFHPLVWVAAVLNLVVFHMLFAYMWPQVVLLDQPFRQTLANSVRCMLAFLPHALAASIIQIVFWGLVILCMPLGILLMIVFGFWFTCELCCQIVSGDLERVFHIEEQIRAKKEAELAQALAAERQEGGEPQDEAQAAQAESGVWPPRKGTTGDGTEK